MKIGDIAFVAVSLVFAVLLYWLTDYAVKNLNTKFRLLYLFPAIIGMAFIAIFGFEWSMLGAYAGVLLLASGFFRDAPKIRKWSVLISACLTGISVLICLMNPFYRADNYVDDFKEAVSEMKKHYVLTAEKEIDFDALYETYLPQFEEAYKKQDAVLNAAAWIQFTREFDDMHVDFSTEDADVLSAAYDRLFGNDYGLALMTLSDGRTVAVNVEENSEAANAGIKNGTEILAWDGKSIEEQKQAITMTVLNFASEENREFYDAILVAGQGGENVSVTYLDENGNSNETVLHKLGGYSKRVEETLELIDQGAPVSNLEWQNVTEKTALLRLREMSYDSESDESADFSQMREELTASLSALKEQGVQNIILDLRSNGGGSGDYVKTLAELFAPEGEHVYACDGVFNTDTCKYEKDNQGRYQIYQSLNYHGQNLWEHGRIVLLVNAETVSAGDHLTKVFEDFPNVTIIGFTHSSCSAQGIHAVFFDKAALTYSAVLLLNEDGSVFVDTDANLNATTSLDIQIPFDEKAVEAIFCDKTDYVLEQAVKELEAQNKE